MFSALLILGCALGDKFGAKSVFAWGFGVFTFGSIGYGLADGMAMLIMLRCIQGIGAALLVPTSLTLITLTFQNANTRRTAVALWVPVAVSLLLPGRCWAAFSFNIWAGEACF
nr:MFS transporter [Pantoea agglomerans]